MKRLFSFFLRLFIAFLAAKLVLAHLGADTPKRLVLLTLVLLGNAYLFDLLIYWNQDLWRRLHRKSQSPDPPNPASPRTP